MKSRIRAAGLAEIDERLQDGERLTCADGIHLFECRDLLAVGWLANREREKRHGGRAYFNIHTSFAPGGEIRGFLAPVPEPAVLSMLGVGLCAISLRRRRRG